MPFGVQSLIPNNFYHDCIEDDFESPMPFGVQSLIPEPNLANHDFSEY